ncbi:UNVERIFIED_CONTAM: Serine/threonine-protein kinase STY8 [Sesamum calycinum]|uniref:Serine/threonine-protein kinase STY8 n=2 Tax=Sesamum TaxID=4181 RepID=A0AAW2SAN5_9LAMI
MDLKKEESVVGTAHNSEEGALELRVKDVGSVGDNRESTVFLRADKIDFKTWDVQLEKHLSRAWSRDTEAHNKPEEWEIDLAKLDIKNVIAHGTYGTVYKGVYDGQDVAAMSAGGEDGIATAAESAALRASFKQEVAVWQKLDHPNVTKFIGASMGTSNLKIPSQGTLAGSFNSLPSRACCVVVEYIPGGTLKKFLIRNSRKKLAFRVVIQLAVDLARGSESTDMTGNTGTLGYMAPEVLDGKPYNRKCDVYSFGICLWEIYCCDMPYPDLSFADVSAAVVQQNLRPEIPRCCPGGFASIMRKCWDAKPENRPEMDEVVRLLEAVDTSKGGGMIPDDQAGGCFCFRRARGP